MRMDEIGYNHKHDRNFYIDRPTGAGDWLLLIVKSPAIFRIDGKNIRTPAHTFIIFTPEYPQFYRPDCDEYFDDWIHFGPDDDELELMKQLEIPFNTPVAVSDSTDISDIVKHMCFEQYSANTNRVQSVDLYFRLLLYKLNEKNAVKFNCSFASKGPYFEKLLWIRESIFRWPSRDYSIDDMAKELSLSRSRFQHLYTEAFGVSVSKDLIASRLHKAVELLNTTNLSVTEIASSVGYSTTQYFIRQFKGEFGITPSQYKSAERVNSSTPSSVQSE